MRKTHEAELRSAKNLERRIARALNTRGISDEVALIMLAGLAVRIAQNNGSLKSIHMEMLGNVNAIRDLIES